jgi:hypothetical protein
LLYVGISDTPSSRMGSHESDKWWWWLVDQVVWEKCWSRDEAKQAESELIGNHHPLFNKAESLLTAWQRMNAIIRLLWSHSLNPHMVTCCPFCESAGLQEMLSPSSAEHVFRRNSDDKLVIHFETDCGMHGTVIEWAVHVDALSFLNAFGQMPKLEIEKMWCDARSDAPWEKRADRMPTLAEMVENGLPIKPRELRLESLSK